MQLNISPFMDRTKGNLAKLQLSFINYIVVPMFESFCKLLPKMKFAFDNIEANKKYWQQQEQKPAA